MDAAQRQVQADRCREPEHSTKSCSKLEVVGNGDTVVCDLRDACQAKAFDRWNEQQPELASKVDVVALRAWMLWPRLRSTSWEKRIVDISITAEADGTNTIELVELAECGVGEGQYHRDYYEVSACIFSCCTPAKPGFLAMSMQHASAARRREARCQVHRDNERHPFYRLGDCRVRCTDDT